jgi:hypothetical protein
LSTNRTTTDVANQYNAQRLALRYLSDHSQNVWTIEGACVQARDVANRWGAPADAITRTYLIEHPGEAWSFRLRAVWRCGTLHEPMATHTIIEGVFNDEDRYRDETALKAAISDWFMSL